MTAAERRLAVVASSVTTSKTCRFCGRELEKKKVSLPGWPDRFIDMPCTCDEAREQAQREEDEEFERNRAEAFGEVWRRTGIPEEFSHVTADFSKADALAGGGAVYICGPNGVGKTTRACELAKGYLIRSVRRDHTYAYLTKSALFVPWQEILTRMKGSWDRWDQREDMLFNRWAGVGLLVVDDVGKGVPSEWAGENLFRLIDARWSNHRPMILTSQYDTYDLSLRYNNVGEETMMATLSRLRGWCDGIRLDGPDRRSR